MTLPRQIKPRILKLTIRRRQGTICIVFICVCWAENDFYRVLSAGQLSLTAKRTAGGMQGAGNEEENGALSTSFPGSHRKCTSPAKLLRCSYGT